jgi:hypothetical protein
MRYHLACVAESAGCELTARYCSTVNDRQHRVAILTTIGGRANRQLTRSILSRGHCRRTAYKTKITVVDWCAHTVLAPILALVLARTLQLPAPAAVIGKLTRLELSARLWLTCRVQDDELGEQIATEADTRRALLDRSGRPGVPIRKVFVQTPGNWRPTRTTSPAR